MRLGAGCALTNDTAAENPLSNTIGVVGRTHQCPTPITRGGLPLHYCTRKRLVTERLMGKARGRSNSRFRRRVIRSAYFGLRLNHPVHINAWRLRPTWWTTGPREFRRSARRLPQRVLSLTLDGPSADAAHWTGAAMAEAVGMSVSSVQRIWHAHGLQPHRIRQFKLSNDPLFIAKLRDIVGLYVNPPDHAIVLSVDEKSQIQALDRTQPGLPIRSSCGDGSPRVL
jgi:hypothetical protein